MSRCFMYTAKNPDVSPSLSLSILKILAENIDRFGEGVNHGPVPKGRSPSAP